MALGDTRRVTSEAVLRDGGDEDGRDEDEGSGGAALAGERKRTWGGEERENVAREWEEINN